MCKETMHPPKSKMKHHSAKRILGPLLPFFLVAAAMSVVWLSMLLWIHGAISERNRQDQSDTNLAHSSSSQQNMMERRVCLSPESNVPWVLSGECKQQGKYGVSRLSYEQRSCGFCSSPYLQSMANKLEKYQDQCHDLVVYGVAFGTKYVEFIHEGAKFNMDQSVCSFHFVLQEDADIMGDLHQNEILVTVDPSQMPYKDMRRNVKILKMGPLDLFPWADRVIWRDTKLLPKKILPSSYMWYFENTVDRFDACVSLVSLPIHDSSMGPKYDQLKFPEYKAHCDAVVDAAIKRPTVSDGLETLSGQCQRTLEQYDDEPRIDGTNFLDRSIIDSAIMVWEQRDASCRKYIGDLTCSWLDEIHCYSDRDQVSFGRALDASGARQSEKLPNGDQIFLRDNRPIVHIARPDCHWYFQPLDACYDTKFHNLKVAVVVAGTYQRFMFSSLLEHVLSSLVRQSHTVDLFLSLSTGPAEAYRFNGTFYPDPRLQGKAGRDLEKFLIGEVNRVGASMGAINIVDQISIDKDPLIKKKWKEVQAKYPKKNPFEYFPVLDVRNKDVIKRNAVGNLNFLRLFRAIENLWGKVTKNEKKVGRKYDYVMFLRDDSMWFRDFHLNGVVSLGGDIFIPACDKRDPKLDPHEISDHGMVARRGVAEIFGRYFSKLLTLDLNKCTQTLPPEFNKKGKRGCNTEMILKWMADYHNLTVTKVGQGYLQFQRAARVQTVNGTIVECFHKYCQSKQDPLIIGSTHADMKICKTLQAI